MSKKFTKCYLHIGTEKTGTTAIQSYLATNRDLLRQQGVLFPVTFGPKANHFQLAVYGQNDGKVDDLRRTIGVKTPEAVRRHRIKLEQQFEKEVEEAGDVSILLLSNEHCHSRLVTEKEIARLHGLLVRWCDEFEIIVYLRPQHELALSLYSTHIKLGGISHNPFPSVDWSSDYYNYNRFLSRWAKVFGEDNIKVRVYSSEEFVGGDLLADFASNLPLITRNLKPGARANESLSLEGIAFLRGINQYLPRFVDGKPNPARRDIAAVMERLYPGSGPVATRSAVKRFYRIFEPSNAKVCKRFLSHRTSLFCPDFTRYPDREEEATITVDEAFRIFAEIWQNARI